MQFTFAFLWTDFFFLGLVLCFLLVLAVPTPRHVTLAWKAIANSPMAMGSLVIMVFYASIALLDCVHFKLAGSNEIISVLDLMMAPLNQIAETTYSAPFVSEGLNYPDQSHSLRDILFRTTLFSAGWALFTGLLASFLCRRTQCRKTLVITLTLTVFACAWMFIASRHTHIFGTDKIGQDVFYQSVKSIRTGVLIGTLTTLVMFPFALFFGTIAGYFRGWVDDLVQYVYTTLSSIPDVLLIVSFMLMLELVMGRFPDAFNNIAMRADMRLLALCLIFGLTSWTSLCRLLRAETFKLREQDYVRAGRVLGSSNARILTRHIVPNLMHLVFITLAMDFSALVLAEAVLSYVGVGVDPSTFSWGNMINAARLELARDPVVWWSLAAAFIFMFTLVLSANLFADVVQKSFDPRARSGR
jgi:peptide/nickel transport system permease protein